MALDADIYLVQGDWGDTIELTLKAKGQPIDLAAAQMVTLLAQHTTKKTDRIEGTCAVVQPTTVDGVPTGRANFVPAEGSIVKPGTYNVQARIEWEDGHITTVPNYGYKQLEITPTLARS